MMIRYIVKNEHIFIWGWPKLLNLDKEKSQQIFKQLLNSVQVVLNSSVGK